MSKEYEKILEYISSEEEKNEKKRMEYLEVGDNKRAEKYEEKQMMFNRMYNLIKYAIYYIEKSDSKE